MLLRIARPELSGTIRADEPIAQSHDLQITLGQGGNGECATFVDCGPVMPLRWRLLRLASQRPDVRDHASVLHGPWHCGIKHTLHRRSAFELEGEFVCLLCGGCQCD